MDPATPTSPPPDASAPPSFDPVDAWRRRATDVYVLVMAAVLLASVLAVQLSPRLSTVHKLLVLLALFPTLAAAVLRRIPFRLRVLLILLSVWIFTAASLHRGGVFLNVRLPLVLSPLPVFILAGIRSGLAVTAINLLLLFLSFLATELGWLPQAPPPWVAGEGILQGAATLAIVAPNTLLLAWFSHHLTKSIRLEHAVAARLRTEAAERERLESAVLDAGERESHRIGAELHDGVCQDLTGLAIRSRRAQKELQAGGHPEAEALSGIVEGLGEAIGEIHGLSRRLSPGRLTGRDLAGALDDLVRRTAEGTEAKVDFSAEGDGIALDSRTTLHLYRIAQEALSNAVHHAGAGRIEVRLSHRDGITRLRIDDDGQGLPPGPAGRGGLGLGTMRWRAVKIGGNLAAGPRPGGGTRVECRLADAPGREEAADEP